VTIFDVLSVWHPTFTYTMIPSGLILVSIPFKTTTNAIFVVIQSS